VCVWGGGGRCEDERVKQREGREDQAAGHYQLPVRFVVGSGRTDNGCRFVSLGLTFLGFCSRPPLIIP